MKYHESRKSPSLEVAELAFFMLGVCEVVSAVKQKQQDTIFRAIARTKE